MSIVNAFMYQDCAQVCVDTDVAGPGGDIGHISKMTPVIHLNAVLAGRGSPPFFMRVTAACLFAREDLDGLFASLAQNLSSWFHEFVGLHVSCGHLDTSDLDAQEIVLVGWSPNSNSPVGRVFKQACRTEGFVEANIEGRWFSPWDDSWNSPQLNTMADVIDLAKAQARLIRETAPNGAAGGKFVVAEITRDGMTIKSVCDFPARSGAL